LGRVHKSDFKTRAAADKVKSTPRRGRGDCSKIGRYRVTDARGRRSRSIPTQNIATGSSKLGCGCV
jgi:hypothetical protein